MAVITDIIPEQGFEVVRDLISAIIKTELDNQKILQTLSENINVFSGRSSPFQHSEVLMINVLLDSADYSNTHEKGTHGSVGFFIDVYTTAKETENDDGGYLSTQRRDKYVGMIRYILQDHHYKTLGLPPGLIMGTYIDGFENFEPSNQQDSSFVKMNRISFSVRVVENQTLWAGVDIASIFTDVKLDLTTKGYKYETIIN